MSSEIAFETAGKREGLQVWRIENFALNHIPQSQFGNFYNGDCYLVLSSKKSGSGKPPSTSDWGLNFRSRFTLWFAFLDWFKLITRWTGCRSRSHHANGRSFERIAHAISRNRRIRIEEIQKLFPRGNSYQRRRSPFWLQSCWSQRLYRYQKIIACKRKEKCYCSRSSSQVCSNNVIIASVWRHNDGIFSWASFNNGDVFIIDIGQGLIQWNSPQVIASHWLPNHNNLSSQIVKSVWKAVNLRGAFATVNEEAEFQLWPSMPDQKTVIHNVKNL